MGLKLYPEDSVQAIADAIRAKNGTSDTYRISEMASAINAIPVPSGSLSIAFNGVYDVKSFASAEVDVPEPSGIYSITSNGIYDVKSFASADVNVSGSGDDRFAMLVNRQISGIVTISEEISVGAYAFYSCSRLKGISAISLSDIAYSAFADCKSLEDVYISGSLLVSDYAFAGCSMLKKVNMPTVKNFGSNIFNGCSSLSDASFPELSAIPVCAFQNCVNLEAISFPNVTQIGRSAFASCKKLLSLYLMASSRVYLNNSSAFNSTPIGGYTASTGGVYGSIFVPASLYSDYLTANYWSLYSDRFVSV